MAMMQQALETIHSGKLAFLGDRQKAELVVWKGLFVFARETVRILHLKKNTLGQHSQHVIPNVERHDVTCVVTRFSRPSPMQGNRTCVHDFLQNSG